MIMEALDVRDCLRMQVLIDTRPSARLFMADFADHAATKIRSSRNPRVRPATLALTAGQWFGARVAPPLGARRDFIIPVWH